jgi:hypothetical protein
MTQGEQSLLGLVVVTVLLSTLTLWSWMTLLGRG